MLIQRKKWLALLLLLSSGTSMQSFGMLSPHLCYYFMNLAGTIEPRLARIRKLPEFSKGLSTNQETAIREILKPGASFEPQETVDNLKKAGFSGLQRARLLLESRGVEVGETLEAKDFEAALRTDPEDEFYAGHLLNMWKKKI